MILPCPSCTARFMVPDERITRTGVKVRCPKCHFVFIMKQQQKQAAAGGEAPARRRRAAAGGAASSGQIGGSAQPRPRRKKKRRRKRKPRPKEVTAVTLSRDELEAAGVSEEAIVDMDELAQTTEQSGGVVSAGPKAEHLERAVDSGPSIMIDDSLVAPEPKPAAAATAGLEGETVLDQKSPFAESEEWEEYEEEFEEEYEEEAEPAAAGDDMDIDIDIDIDIDEVAAIPDKAEIANFVAGSWTGGDVYILPADTAGYEALDAFEGLLVEEKRAIRVHPALKVGTGLAILALVGFLGYLIYVRVISPPKPKLPSWGHLQLRGLTHKKVRRKRAKSLVRVEVKVINASKSAIFKNVHVRAAIKDGDGKEKCSNWAPCGPRFDDDEIAGAKEANYRRFLRRKAKATAYLVSLSPNNEESCQVLLFCGDRYRVGHDSVDVTIDKKHTERVNE